MPQMKQLGLTSSRPCPRSQWSGTLRLHLRHSELPFKPLVKSAILGYPPGDRNQRTYEAAHLTFDHYIGAGSPGVDAGRRARWRRPLRWRRRPLRWQLVWWLARRRVLERLRWRLVRQRLEFRHRPWFWLSCLQLPGLLSFVRLCSRDLCLCNSDLRISPRVYRVSKRCGCAAGQVFNRVRRCQTGYTNRRRPATSCRRPASDISTRK